MTHEIASDEQGNRFLMVPGEIPVRVYCAAEIARKLGVTDQTVRNWAAQDGTPACRIPRYWDEDGLTQWHEWQIAHRARKRRVASEIQNRLNRNGEGLYSRTDVARLMGLYLGAITNFPNPPAPAAHTAKGFPLWDAEGVAQWQNLLQHKAIRAHRAYRRFAPWEDVIVLNDALTTAQKAERLRRTANTVLTRYKLLKKKQKVSELTRPDCLSSSQSDV